MRISHLGVCAILFAGLSAQTSTRSSTASAAVPEIPVQNATLSGQPSGVSVAALPDSSKCNYTSNDLYCFPSAGAFVTMTGWTRLFYNRNYGLLRGSALVDVTMYFATNDLPAANWIGVGNTGDIPINVNISWFTSTLAPVATQAPGVRGVADPYYFYVRPNSAVYNALPTVSNKGPTFYAVQTPRLLANVAPTATDQATATITTTANLIAPSASATANRTDSGLSSGAIAGIVIGVVALVFGLAILAFLLVLVIRRDKFWKNEKAALAAQTQNDQEDKEKTSARSAAYGPTFTDAELQAAGLTIAAAPQRSTSQQRPWQPNPYIQRVGGRPRPQHIMSNQGNFSVSSASPSGISSGPSSPGDNVTHVNPMSYAVPPTAAGGAREVNSHQNDVGVLESRPPQEARPTTADPTTSSAYSTGGPAIVSRSQSLARPSKATLMDFRAHRPQAIAEPLHRDDATVHRPQISPRGTYFRNGP